MHTIVLSSKGQVIIPKSLRVQRRWSPGTRLEVHDTPDGVLLRPAAPATKVDLAIGLAAIRRRLGSGGPVLSTDEMNDAVRGEAQRRAPRTTCS